MNDSVNQNRNTVVSLHETTPDTVRTENRESEGYMKKDFIVPVLLAVVIGLGGWTLFHINELDSEMSAVRTQLSSHEKSLNDLKSDTNKIESKIDKVEDKVDEMRLESLKAFNEIKLELAKFEKDKK
ncbi:hypothetical protein C4G95_RS20510 [Vibrio parahaemolyticus]|nr:hypothetical protein [Vibrio parahaemolyticus]